jgi:hypothetical protein
MPGLHVQLDVEYANDPKMIDAGPLAELLYVRSLCFAKRTMRNGHITRSQLRAISLGIPSASRHAERLCEVGAWEKTDDGWRITAWLRRNKSAERIARETAAKRLKSLMGNHERWHVKEAKFDPTCELCNPHDDPCRDPRGDPVPDSTEAEAEAEAQPEAEAESSSSGPESTVIPFPDRDDDDFHQVVGIVLEGREREYATTIRNARAWRATVRKQIIAEDGELIRKMLDGGDPSEQVAAFVLGFGMTSHHARDYAPIAWCDQSCPVCDGDNFVYPDDPTVAHPCPNRVQRKENTR